MKKKLTLICSLLFLYSCNEQNSEKYLSNSVGAINSLSLVIDNELWNGEVGDEIRKHFAAPVDGLPWEEPLFSIHQMPLAVFTGFARNSRNILILSKDTLSFGVGDNLYAQPQKVAHIKGQNNHDFLQLIDKHAPDLIKMYKKHDIEENQKRIKLSLNKETAIKEKLGVSLTMPSAYKIVKQENNFFWIERQIPKGTMNIIIYELPMNEIPNDSTRVDAIIKMRDSIGEKYIPGREQGMHMITEKAYAPYVFDVTIAGKNAIETRGMWEVKNFFMAGPFLNYIIEDPLNNRLLVEEGFTFAPSTNKRDYMFELEAILKSVKIEKKKER
jgi:Domain of unknown function (DUF4837)